MSPWFPFSARQDVRDLAARMTTLEAAVTALKEQIDALAQPLLVKELLARAEQADRSKRELADQAEHLLQLLSEARKELRELKGG